MKTKGLSLSLLLVLSAVGMLALMALLIGGVFTETYADPLSQITPTLTPPPDTRFVAPSGNDTGDCKSYTAPCKTIQYAVNQADAGNEIWIATFDVQSTGGLPPTVVTTTARYTEINTLDGHPQVIYLTKSVTLRGGYTYLHLVPGSEMWIPGPIPATVDAQGNGRCLYISGDVTPTVELLAFVEGQADMGGNV
ncbi:MAG TPA: hypothetical protein ENG33_10970, partial [Chloroflexi bacterium]|nr:hypothetical protein [Chloroflexota bacterium]